MPASPSPFVIRAATPRDGERVAEMAAALARDEGAPPSRFSAEAFRRDGFGRTPAFACLVAERGGAPSAMRSTTPITTRGGSRAGSIYPIFMSKRRRGGRGWDAP